LCLLSGLNEHLRQVRAQKNISGGCFAARHHLPQPSPRAECLLQLIIAQLAVLLQLTQLWTVLGDLAPAVETAANVAPVDDSAQGILADF
jgi:hypothetical protein